MTKRRATDEDYAAMAASYEADPPGADEIVGPIEINPAFLRNGRPGGTDAARGKTPTMAIRLPEPIRAAVEQRVQAGASRSASEFIRVAVVEYLERHPQ